MDDKKNIFMTLIVGLIAMTGGLVGPTIFEDELANHYVCVLNNEAQSVAEFDRISGTAYSGYPFADSNSGAVRCGNTDNKGTK